MQVPLEIDFENMEPSDFIAARVRERVAKLERFFDGIVRCHVTIEAPHKHHHKGYAYHVGIALHVPGRELVVSRDPGNRDAHRDVYVAIRDAFDAAERQLEDYARKLRHDIKARAPAIQGRIVRLFPDRGYGFIATTEGAEIYFHRNSVINGGFEELKAGQAVQLVIAEDESPQGPQATTVRAIGALRLHP